MAITKKNFIRYTLFLITLILCTHNAFAQPRTLSTGIGIDQRQDTHSDYSLKLIFFVDTGGLLANMDLEITKINGNPVLTTNSYGPWFFVDLTPGTYRITATRQNGDSQGAVISISTRKQRTVALMYPDR